MVWNSNKQIVSVREKESSPSAACSVDLTDALVGVGVSLLNDVNFACSADRIDAMALAVIKDVIRIAGYSDAGNNLARVGVKNHELRWDAAPDN